MASLTMLRLSLLLCWISILFSTADAKRFFRGIGLTTDATEFIPVQIDATEAPVETNAPVGLENIGEIAAGEGDLSILLEVVKRAGFADFISTMGPFTVFAPTNEAFAEVFPDAGDLDLVDVETLTTVLTYHVVPGIYLASDITDGLKLKTVQGETIEFGIDGGNVTVNEEVISATDISGSNGVIHKIDGVMFPQTVLPAEEAEEETSSDTIVDLAAADEDLSSLLEAVTLAGYADLVSSAGPFTIFAPTNAAFAEVLPNEGDLEALDPTVLMTVVAYHVVPGTYLASDITNGLTLKTVQGETIEFGVDGDVVTVNEEVISATDISGSNGVIHKIDGIMFPQAILG